MTRCLLSFLFMITALGCATSRPVSNNRRGFFDRKKSWVVQSQREKSVLPWGGSKNRKDQKIEQSRGELSQETVSDLNELGLKWPLHSVFITSSFGKRGKDFHEGIDLRAPHGTPVFAAQTGEVLYAGTRIRGYGKLIVLRHPSKIATIYAHNSSLLVRRGQRVHRGQQIAISGNTGRSSGPHLHFEVRRGLSPLDPTPYLPKLVQTLKPQYGFNKRWSFSEKKRLAKQ